MVGVPNEKGFMMQVRRPAGYKTSFFAVYGHGVASPIDLIIEEEHGQLGPAEEQLVDAVWHRLSEYEETETRPKWRSRDYIITRVRHWLATQSMKGQGDGNYRHATRNIPSRGGAYRKRY